VAAIGLIDLSKDFGAALALDRMTLRIREGELVTILGPSGSGKTTVLSLIAGLIDPSNGSIFLGDRDVTRLPPARRNIGFVFQNYALFPHLSVFDNIAFPLSIRKRPSRDIQDRVRDMLALVRLDGFEERRPDQLSGGQQQRVALARALAFEPDVLLLDEPMGALDRGLRTELQAELRDLQRRLGVTTVLVTHDQEEALSLSDRVAVLALGQLQQIATPEEIYRRPRNAFVAGLLGAANILEGRMETGADGRRGLRAPTGELLRVDAPFEAQEGSRLQCLIRPEGLRVALRDDSEGALRAVVSDAVFLGQAARYHLTTEAGRSLVASSAPAGPSLLRRGDAVMVSWDEADIWVFPESDGAPGPR